jgi:tetratricopeptide (TPR) repeat protein
MTTDGPEQLLRDALHKSDRLGAEGNLQLAIESLDEAIRTFRDAHGELPPLAKPFALSAELLHRLGQSDQAHARLERLVTLARTHSDSRPGFLADAFCWAGLAELNVECAGSVRFYEQAIDEGDKAGLSDRWMIRELLMVVSSLLKFQPHSNTTLAYAKRAASLAASVPEVPSLLFVAQFNLGCAQLDADLNHDAATTFETLLRNQEKLEASRKVATSRIEELKMWLAKARGID